MREERWIGPDFGAVRSCANREIAKESERQSVDAGVIRRRAELPVREPLQIEREANLVGLTFCEFGDAQAIGAAQCVGPTLPRLARMLLRNRCKDREPAQRCAARCDKAIVFGDERIGATTLLEVCKAQFQRCPLQLPNGRVVNVRTRS